MIKVEIQIRKNRLAVCSMSEGKYTKEEIKISQDIMKLIEQHGKYLASMNGLEASIGKSESYQKDEDNGGMYEGFKRN